MDRILVTREQYNWYKNFIKDKPQYYRKGFEGKPHFMTLPLTTNRFFKGGKIDLRGWDNDLKRWKELTLRSEDAPY